jgi:hypothetical protein
MEDLQPLQKQSCRKQILFAKANCRNYLDSSALDDVGRKQKR